MMRFATLLLAILAMFCGTMAFQPPQTNNRRIKGSSLKMTVLSYGGKKRDFKAGSSLKSAVSALGVKPKYSCTK
jgi:hypothetical protein